MGGIGVVWRMRFRSIVGAELRVCCPKPKIKEKGDPRPEGCVEIRGKQHVRTSLRTAALRCLATRPYLGCYNKSLTKKALRSRLACIGRNPIVSPMRPVLALGIYISAVFLGGALIAPGFYWITQAAGLTHLAATPFHRFVNRSLLGIALIGLWPLLRTLGARSREDVGLALPDMKQLSAGFALGFISFAMVPAAALWTGARAPASTYHHLTQKLVGAALTALVVGTLEEILFRGGIFGALRRNLNWIVALIGSSMIYALVHFLGNPHQAGPVFWYSGLELLPRMLEGFVHWQRLVPGFFNLTIAGALLALAYQRTGNLCFSIGLHAGWIFWLKSYAVVTQDVRGAHTWIWGENKLIDSWLAFLVLCCTLLFFWGSAPVRDRSNSNSAKIPA